MGWERYLFHDFFTAEELNELDKRIAFSRRIFHETRATTKARITVLEEDLGRVALLARALADLCIAKGVLSGDELARQLMEADLADGKRDGKLQPKVVMPGESKPADPEPSRDPAARKSRMKRSRPYP